MSIGGDIEGLNPTFKARLDQLATVCNVTVNSGYRSTEEQAVLYQKYLSGQGNLAAPPGKSNHNKGMAADIEGDKACAHQHAAYFGLVFSVQGEDWHIEPVDIAAIEEGSVPGGEFTDQAQQPMAVPMQTDPFVAAAAAMTMAIANGPPSAADGVLNTSTTPEALGSALGAKPVTPPAAPAAPTGGGTATGDTFYEKLLNRLGLPVSPENIRLMEAWAQAEGMKPESNNPFATTEGNTPGVVGNWNSVGVKLYDTMESGVEATYKTLTNGRYQGILDALGRSDLAGAAAAIEASPWGTGGLVRKILGV